MRILLVLTCCVGLALFAGAAQPEDAGNHQGKKKGGDGNAPAQQVTTQQTGKKLKTGPGGGPHTQNFQQSGAANYTVGNKANKAKWDGQTQTNVAVDPNGWACARHEIKRRCATRRRETQEPIEA